MTPIRPLLALNAGALVLLPACDPNSRHHSISCDTFETAAVIQCVDGATGHRIIEFPADLDLHGSEDDARINIHPDPNHPGELTITITWEQS